MIAPGGLCRGPAAHLSPQSHPWTAEPDPGGSMDITATDEWAALVDHHREISARTLRELFAEDPGRAQRLTGTAGDLYLDWSKHRVTDETLRLLVALAEKAGVPGRIEAMFRGDHINVTEDRAVLHVALRAPESVPLTVDGQDVTADVHAVLAT